MKSTLNICKITFLFLNFYKENCLTQLCILGFDTRVEIKYLATVALSPGEQK